MSTMTELITSYLLQDATITAHTSTRIYSRDVRTAGPDTPSPFPYGSTGVPLVHLIVKYGGGVAPPLGPSGAYQDQVRVSVVVPNTSAGRSSLDQLAQRIPIRLHRWQESSTKALMTRSLIGEPVVDPPPHAGVQQVLTFNVAGVTIGIAQ